MRKVLISGGWDLMHVNHIKTLRAAKAMGDFLVVNVLSDERMKAKKGPNRPITPLAERMEIMRELRCVDQVICIPGDQYPLFKAIDYVQPDIVCINIDEQPNIDVEVAYCKNSKTEVVGIQRIDDGVSTTKLIERFKNA